jgi:serine protease Do
MSRRFALVTVVLVATGAFLIGLILAGSMTPAPATSDTRRVEPAAPERRGAAAAPALVNFADIAERINPAVVNIDATARGREDDRERPPFEPEEPTDGPPRRGTGSGVIIEPDGHVLTNHHVIERAERILVKLADGRTLRATVIGSDPETDIALVKIDAPQPFPTATLGNSDRLRVGEWVCAIGNPLAYEHTVTVGVISFIGRKLFDRSLDNYIQTDAAINFGNSGGPLINARGEVIGINAAISSRASNIGFAVPVNQARDVIPQLKARGRVARGYLGVAPRDLDPDLRRSLGLEGASGALVQDVTEGSPGARAGLKPYDLITAIDGHPVPSNDALIRRIASTAPGTAVTVEFLRDARPQKLVVKLAERPGRSDMGRERPAVRPTSNTPPLGLAVRDLAADDIARLGLPGDVRGVMIARVDPLGPASDASLERGQIILEVNRRAVRSADELRHLLDQARDGDVLTLFVYLPDEDQRALRTVRVDAP